MNEVLEKYFDDFDGACEAFYTEYEEHNEYSEQVRD